MNIEKVESKTGIPIVQKHQGFWFIRTQGGKFFNHFSEEGIVGIFHNNITLSSILTKDGLLKNENQIDKVVKKAYPNHKRPGLIVSQITRFIDEVRDGDYVFIPSRKTQMLLIGLITDDTAREKTIILDKNKHVLKYKKVKWLKRIPRGSLNPNVLSIVHSHQTICDASDYARYFLNGVRDFYKYDDTYHILIRVASEEDVDADSVITILSELMKGAKKLKTSGKYDRKISLKTNMDSPGEIAFLTSCPEVAAYLASILLLSAIFGAEVTLPKDIKIGFKKSIFERISEYLKEKENINKMKIINECYRKIGAENPRDAIKLFQNETVGKIKKNNDK